MDAAAILDDFARRRQVGVGVAMHRGGRLGVADDVRGGGKTEIISGEHGGPNSARTGTIRGSIPHRRCGRARGWFGNRAQVSPNRIFLALNTQLSAPVLRAGEAGWGRCRNHNGPSHARWDEPPWSEQTRIRSARRLSSGPRPAVPGPPPSSPGRPGRRSRPDRSPGS
jgi:hypothetical protein